MHSRENVVGATLGSRPDQHFRNRYRMHEQPVTTPFAKKSSGVTVMRVADIERRNHDIGVESDHSGQSARKPAR